MMVDSFNYFLLFHVNGQFLPKFLYLFRMVDFEISLRNHQIFVSDVFKTVRLVFIIRELNSLLFLYYSERLLSESLAIELASHELLGLVEELILISHGCVGLMNV